MADDWRPVMDDFLGSAAGLKLAEYMRVRLAAGAVIYPSQPFRALALTSLSQVKVVILGQDPYHGAGQADGLAFSVAPGVKPPPSLRNIFKEIEREALFRRDARTESCGGSLVRWAQQGVLLINTSLTVESGQPASHARRGWEMLTDAIVKAVGMKEEPLVFMLWGAHAQAKQMLIEASSRNLYQQQVVHLVLTANHPSPLSAMRPPKPFHGCGHFESCNAYLKQYGRKPIEW
jgi:uracil-DNA glycosylase